jgi:hypothetical protein
MANADESKQSKKKRGLALPVLVAGGVGSLLLAASMNTTFSAFVASITNSTNTAGTAALSMRETDASGSVICDSTDGGSISTNAATCATINKYGGNLAMVPGQTVSTTVKIKNTGSVAANTFTLTPGAVTQSANGSVNGSATDLGAKIKVVIKQDGATVANTTASALATGGVITLTGPVTAGTTSTFNFDVTLDASAGNAYQGLQISQPLTWTFNS